MENIQKSKGLDLRLDEVLARLACNETVVGILKIGSLASDLIQDESDYDLVIILDGKSIGWMADTGWFVGITQIDQRFHRPDFCPPVVCRDDIGTPESD